MRWRGFMGPHWYRDRARSIIRSAADRSLEHLDRCSRLPRAASGRLYGPSGLARALLRGLAMKLHRAPLVLAVAASVALAAGCKKKQRYSPSCQRSVTLTAPWDGLKLPS